MKILQKKGDYLFELADGRILRIDRPQIETHFCYGWGAWGMGYEESLKAAARTKTDVEIFKSENLKDLNEKIDFLKSFTMAEHFLENRLPALYFSDFDSKYCFLTFRRADIVGDKNCVIIDRATAREVLECYEFAKKEFKKRIEIYLKKYGLSKLTVWTYCADD